MSSSPSTGSASPIDLTHLVLKERTISALLRKLDMDNRAEQLDFKRLLRFYMNWEPGFTDGFYRDELIKMKDVELHYYAKDFLDSAKLVSFNEPAGNTFWPSHAFISTSSPKPQPKRLTYAENRSDIIDLVTQILILQRKSTERKESEKKKKSRTRARNKQATAGSAAVQSTISETLEDKRGCKSLSQSTAKKPRTGIASAARTSEINSTQIPASSTHGPCDMLNNSNPETRHPLEQNHNVGTQVEPLNGIPGNCSPWEIPAAAASLNLTLSESPAASAESFNLMRSDLPIGVEDTAITPDNERTCGLKRYHDAETQTLLIVDFLRDKAKMELKMQGAIRAHEYLLLEYGRLQRRALSSHGAEAERLSMKAKDVLESAHGLASWLEQPQSLSASENLEALSPIAYT